MSELFRPISTRQLAAWLFGELSHGDSAFGIPRRYFFAPGPNDRFGTTIFGRRLDTPIGPAAGPHTQMAQNIVAAWLCGARYFELKTVQTIDELNVKKPCIDMQDEGYNVEWSQELKVHESFDEYLRAWVLIHALHHLLGHPGDRPAIVFNMSVGYDLEGIGKPNVQWFLEQMSDCSNYKSAIVEQVAHFYPAVRDIPIPDRMSDNVTLSTMHGCPPEEIEGISAYLMQEKHLHTLVKCNPTLLGRDFVRSILNDELGYRDIAVPDIAFDHDLDYADAVPMLTNLQRIALDSDLSFGVKLSNTLEVANSRSVFDAGEKMSYLSGRPLHAITVNLAHRLAGDFEGRLPMSFSAGVNRRNIASLIAAGMRTVTVCSDLLRTGGYLRLIDYVSAVESAIDSAGAANIEDYICRSAGDESDANKAAQSNLATYASSARSDPDNAKNGFDKTHTKTSRVLGAFDCIKAPCADECPLDQDVPAYMRAVGDNKLDEARQIVLADNPIPCTLGRVCDHLCEHACVRTHVDEPLAIRDIKRFIMDSGPRPTVPVPAAGVSGKVAIIGAGPGGIAAASELAHGGLPVEVFEKHPYGGGMVGGAVPEYRLPQPVFAEDFAVLEDLGVKVHFNTEVGRDIRLSELRKRGFDNIVIMAGAQRSKTLGLEGEDCTGVVDALEFLRRSKQDSALDIGNTVGIIGAGDTAMDCARVAWRQNSGKVMLIYRRTIDQMPADREEITQLIEEGIDIVELASPVGLEVRDGKLRALRCVGMHYTGKRDASGRKLPQEVPDSEFEIRLDSLIMAISQHAILDFFDGEPIQLNERGYIDVDPDTCETSVPGIYAGGDVVNDGPASIVKAAAAGKKIARHILGIRASASRQVGPAATDAIIRRRGEQQRRVAAPQTDPGDRRNFNEVVLTFDDAQARSEASRCLDCDTFCSLCVGVCPNIALQTYATAPFSVDLPQLERDGGELLVAGYKHFDVMQPHQVAVLTDLCNECGNCTTFCPTAGRPYRDKPRLYLDRGDFESQRDNAFMVSRDGDCWALDARWGDMTHRIELNGVLDYYGPACNVRLDPESFAVTQSSMTKEQGDLSLRHCAEMYVLLKGLQSSAEFLPLSAGTRSGDKIDHPGYED